MARKITAIEVALLEAEGRAAFRTFGRRIVLTLDDGLQAVWWAATAKQAADQLRLFRAAPKHLRQASEVEA